VSYCLSINTHAGLVLCAATFASDETDNKASPCMHRFIWDGNRFITILSSGNQTTVDNVLNKIHQDLNNHSSQNLLTTNSINETVDYIAAISVKQQKTLIEKHGKSKGFDANFIVSGQINQKKMETLLVYAQGNYIHESNASPFLQIGEIKFGKPILDRIIKRSVDLNTASHCAIVSVDSTVRSHTNKKVKLELLIYKRNSLAVSHHLILDENSDFFKNTSTAWSEGITNAIARLPNFSWEI